MLPSGKARAGPRGLARVARRSLTRWSLRWLGVLVLFAALLGPTAALAGNPDLRWRTIETEHFYVHYYAGEEEIAERVAMVAERAYARLTQAWGHRVYSKTHIVLTDNTDTANGFANTVPYPNVRAFATAPEALSVLEAYDDWVDILITHELVHIVHLDTVHGIARAINAVLGFGRLGRVMQPNVVQPRWIVEGVATMQESKFSSQGRHRSAQFDAYLRMAVLEGQFQALDQVSSAARVWPHGTSLYLYGLHFMNYIASRYGQDKLRELSHVYAGQWVPFGINRAMKRVLGVSFYELWKEFRVDTVRRFRAQARRIRARGLKTGRRLTFEGESTRYPIWSPDDAYIYFYKAAGHREEGIKRIAADGGRIREGVGIGRQGADVDVEHVIDAENASEPSFVPGTHDIVFDMTGTHDFRYGWSDLYRWNGGDPLAAERVTFGQRASEPDVSPDGKWVVFRRNDIGQSRLGLLELATGKVVEVAPLGKTTQVYTPRFSPDGHKIAFSAWREGGYRDIYVYDRRTGRTDRITADRFVDMSPSWSPDGRWIVFSSDRDDVFNIYAWDTREERLHQVSNVLGGAFEPRVSHDGKRLAYIGYASNGFDLWVMDFDPDSFMAVMPAVADLPLPDDPKPELPGQDGRPPSLKSTRYRPIKTFFPRTIMPTALDFSASTFGTGIGFTTAIADVLGFHTLGVSFNYSTATRRPNYALSYRYSRLFPDFEIRLSQGTLVDSRNFVRYLYDRGDDQPSYLVRGYRRLSTDVVVGTSLPVLRHPRHRGDFSLVYDWSRRVNLDANLPIDPNAPSTSLPLVGDLGRIDLSFSHSTLGDGVGRFTYGPEIGRRTAVTTSVLDDALGGDYQDIQVTASHVEYFPMPWRGHQSLELRLRGGASAGGLGGNAFCLGEYTFGPEILGNDIARSLLNRAGIGAGGCSLFRGYPGVGGKGDLVRGQYFAILTGEYHVPILDVDRGIGTLPLFLRRVGMVPFVDVGRAWTGSFDIRDVMVGAGADLVISFDLGYGDPIHLVLHYAHGFDDEAGIDTFRAVVSRSF